MICMSPVTGISFWYFSWTSGDPHHTGFKLHIAVLSTLCVMCPSIAVFCSESIECFPGVVSKFFFKLLVTIPVAPIITGTIVHFRLLLLLLFSYNRTSVMWLLTPCVLQARSLSLHSVTLDPNSSLLFLFRTVCDLHKWCLHLKQIELNLNMSFTSLRCCTLDPV